MSEAPAYETGQTVRIRALHPPGHVRTPAYLRGKTGVIERVLGPYENPEQRAYMLPATEKQLYRIRFSMSEIWGDAAERPDDTLDAEIYHHWIEPAHAP
ncbi:MAG: SH3-like domain-containing protein [Pseudomonadota bacterium]